MISVLAQERVLGFALGAIATSVVIFEERKSIYRMISAHQSPPHKSQFQMEPVFGKKPELDLSHLWNKTVDQTFGPLITALSSRGW